MCIIGRIERHDLTMMRSFCERHTKKALLQYYRHICRPYNLYLHYISARGSETAHPPSCGLLWNFKKGTGCMPMRQLGLITVLTFNEDLFYPLLLDLFYLILSWIFMYNFSSSSSLFLAYNSL
jgi:hypothetical protein